VDTPNRSGAKWSFNGDVERPTFSPSINYRVNLPDLPPNVFMTSQRAAGKAAS
jgi:hypothetical protein